MFKALKYGKLVFWPAMVLALILMITSALYVTDDFDGHSTMGIVSVVFAIISVASLFIDDLYVNLSSKHDLKEFRITEAIFFFGHIATIISFGTNLLELNATGHTALWITNIVSFSVLAAVITAGYVLFIYNVRIKK